MIKKITIITISLLIIGCEKNPILGEWESKPKNNLTFFNMKEKWIFEEDKVIFNGIMEEVEYEINGNRIIVKGTSELSKTMGFNSVFTIINKNTIKKTSILGDDTFYNRTKW